ncbi:hypothetical protein BGZ98_010090 [Dissophora globulifera]|nr:hypothetical protein BGZ98_010090 [Dissophora globulifera]
MRIPLPSIVLLLSATLTLFVRAENATLANSSDNNSDNVRPSLLPADTPQDTIETEETYPVGKGIVYSKHSFFVRKKNKMESDGSSSKSPMDAVHFFGSLLGLDTTNLESGSSSSNQSSGSAGDHREIKKNDMDDNLVEKIGSMWEELSLFGDDGYKPRATPKGCAELEHMDQMIWDQQGDRGAIVKSQEKKTKLTSSDKSASNEDENDEDVIEDDNNSNSSSSESERRQQRKVNHKQRQFLKQFRGKALEIDGSTGCPVPSLASKR